MVDLGEILEVSSRAEWRRWLRANYRTSKGIWLVYYRKGSGRERIPYNDAVEEALCFGWIDSNVKSIDAERFAQRFSPRRPGSPYSPANKERLRRLVADRKVAKSVLPTLGELKEPRFVVAKDILEAIKANKDASAHYRKFSAGYKRIRIGFIEGARNRPAEFQKRLRYFIKMTAKGKQFGFGGIEKYYR
ncbi:MAG TPA: YdeI/OmpD-associated family protein [Anaerolineales bacterium]